MYATILKALKGIPSNKAAAPDNKAVQIALASIKKKDLASKWKREMRLALKAHNTNYGHEQLNSMVSRFEALAKRTTYELAFLETMDTYGNGYPQDALLEAKHNIKL